MSGVAVFSGECLVAVCGLPTGFRDMCGYELFTGDIVVVFTVREYGDDRESLDYLPSGLTAVVSDEWVTTRELLSGERTYRRKEGAPEFFVMGIKNVPMDEPGQWRVMRVKEWSDVIEGERWPAYGFSYQPVPEQVRTISNIEGASHG